MGHILFRKTCDSNQATVDLLGSSEYVSNTGTKSEGQGLQKQSYLVSRLHYRL